MLAYSFLEPYGNSLSAWEDPIDEQSHLVDLIIYNSALVCCVLSTLTVRVFMHLKLLTDILYIGDGVTDSC